MYVIIIRLKNYKDNNVLVFSSLFLVIIILYHNVVYYEFVSYDDVLYLNALQENVRGVWETIFWAFTSEVNFNWSPLTILSLSIDYKIYGLNSGGYHVSNVMLHYVNTLMLFYILSYLLNNKKIAYVIALIFLIHPVNVEAVSWVSERKGLLAAFFTLLSIYFYLKSYQFENKKIYYILSLLFFCFGLLSKAVFVSLPLVLIVIDWYLYKFEYDRKCLIKILYLMIPFFLFSFTVSVVTILVHSKSGAIVSNELNPFYTRLGNATNSYVTYIKQFFYPFNLSFLYRYKEINSIVVLFNVIIIFGIFYLAYLDRNKRRSIALGIAWYTFFLLPVIGFVQSGYHAHADRYAYIPLVGIYIIIITLLFEIITKLKLNIHLVKGFSLLFIVLLMIVSLTQVTAWKNSKYLFEHALLVDSNNYAANTNLAIIYIIEKNLAKAMLHYEKAKKTAPFFLKMYNLISDNLIIINERDIAINVLYDSIKNNPDNIKAYVDISKIRISQNKYLKAIKLLLVAKNLKLNDAEINYLLAYSYHNINQNELAMSLLMQSTRNGPYGDKMSVLLNKMRKLNK